MSAEIIAFPLRSPLTPPDDAQQRLQRALAGLNAAVAGQREAVAQWREALGRLQTTMHDLGDSVLRYRDTLHGVGAQVVDVNVQARALERWADSATAVAADGD